MSTTPGPEQADGPVRVPPDLARPLLRLIVRALYRDARDGAGGCVSPELAAFLRDLESAEHRAPVADNGNADQGEAILEASTCWATAAWLADRSGHPPRTLRHWAATGRVRAVRAGRLWLIDPESLRRNPR